MKVREAIGGSLIGIVLFHIMVGIPIYIVEGTKVGLLVSGVIIVAIALIGLGMWLMTTPGKVKR